MLRFADLSALPTLALAIVLVAAISERPGVAQQPQTSTITIRAARVLDGRGKIITNGVVEVQGTKIVKVDQRQGPVTFDLGDVTVLPGMIDVHTHIDWHFQPNGMYGRRGGQPEEVAAAALPARREGTATATAAGRRQPLLTRLRDAAPLLVALVFLEMSDIIFAVDSVPAIFAISREPFIVFTSNVFAILGLRAMYFMLAGAIERFHLLTYGLAFILIFVGLKMVWLNDLFGGKFPVTWSLAIIALLLAGSIAASLMWPVRRKPGEERPGRDDAA